MQTITSTRCRHKSLPLAAQRRYSTHRPVYSLHLITASRGVGFCTTPTASIRGVQSIWHSFAIIHDQFYDTKKRSEALNTLSIAVKNCTWQSILHILIHYWAFPHHDTTFAFLVPAQPKRRWVEVCLLLLFIMLLQSSL